MHACTKVRRTRTSTKKKIIYPPPSNLGKRNIQKTQVTLYIYIMCTTFLSICVAYKCWKHPPCTHNKLLRAAAHPIVCVRCFCSATIRAPYARTRSIADRLYKSGGGGAVDAQTYIYNVFWAATTRRLRYMKACNADVSVRRME